MTDWPFAPLVPLSYGLLMVDAPWSFRLYSAKGQRKSAQAHYQCMSTADIAALPVGQLAAPDAVLMLWTTAPMLPVAFGVMSGWGFRYVSMGVWHKRTKHRKTAFGTGYRLRSACEPFLLGVIGNPQTSRRHRNLIEGEARGHSRKPEEAYEWAETYLAGARRVELFSRQARANWDAWGNEAGKFDAVA
jgi:N6-adenosine-specific RNA methylase IME4